MELKNDIKCFRVSILYPSQRKYSDSAGKESVCNARDLGLIPGLGRSPGEEKGYLLQYSGLENPMDCIVDGVAESVRTERLSILLVNTM